MKTIYLTTPLYYVNAAPHIGHSYTTIAADAMARFHRLQGRPVFLLTGTDEHGQKIEQAAAAAGQTPKVFVDAVVERFKSLWLTLNISYDDFIRTTEPRHVEVVQAVLSRLREEGKLVNASYQGWYCTPDETFWTEGELGAAALAKQPPLCPTCQRPLESANESGWYLPLRASQEWLRGFLKAHPRFVQPVGRYNEIVSLLEQPLPEYLCITRPKQRVNWGIQVPFSPDHVTYVWFDALLNYITVPGFLRDPDRFAQLWPADVHFIGKDILRHHAVYWPIMLHVLGLRDEQMPTMIFAHGWWKIGEQKMSKSLGNIVDPSVVVGQLLKDQPFAADVYRYFVLREVPFGQDGAFSEDAIFKRLNADLANDLGNLVNRTLTMVQRYSGGAVPVSLPVEQLKMIGSVASQPLVEQALSLPADVDAAMDQVQFSLALEHIMELVSKANQFIELAAPWKLAKAGQQPELNQVLAILVGIIRIVATMLGPFMPSVAESIWRQLGCQGSRRFQDALRWVALPAGQRVSGPQILFPKLELKAS